MWSIISKLIPIRRDIAYLEAKTSLIRLPTEIQTARRKVLAAVVDDQPFAPLRSLRNQGYEISYVGDISDPTQLAQYHIIVCDIRNVGTEFNSALQGGGLIREIKRLYPQKYVIAYSGSFAATKAVRIASEFADARISKSASTNEWCIELDQAVRFALDPISQWKLTRRQMEDFGLNHKEIHEIEKSYVTSVLRGNSINLKIKSNKFDYDGDVRAILQNLIASAIWSAMGFK